MGLESGVFSDGTNVIIRPINATSGKIIVDATNGFEQLIQKSHANYAGSAWNSKTFPLTTTDATVTAIASIPCPSGYAMAIRGFVVGVQNDDSDASVFTAVGVVVNAAGTTALKGTPLYQVVESAAATNITITADDTADAILLNITGIAAETWHWVARVEWMGVNTSA